MSSGNDDQLGGDIFDLPTPDEAPLGDLGAPPSGGGLGDLSLPDFGTEGLDAIDEGDSTKGKKGKKGKKKAKGKDKKPAKKDKSKAKKEKTPKEPKVEAPTEPEGPAGKVWLAICILLAALLIGGDALIVLDVGEAGFTFWVILFLFLVNALGLVAVAVPFFCYIGRRTLNFYEICLGFAVLAMAVGSLLLLLEINRYDGDIKAEMGIMSPPSADSPLETPYPMSRFV